VRVGGALSADFGEPLRVAALSGHGIAMHPYYMVQDDLLQGRLVAVLPEYAPEQHDIHVIYSNRNSLPERARRFLTFLREGFRLPPAWAVPDPRIGIEHGRPRQPDKIRARAQRQRETAK
jgi:DNA-binding transcriptional LysR family regulator